MAYICVIAIISSQHTITERRCPGGTSQLTACIQRFNEVNSSKLGSHHHVSNFEETVDKIRKQFPKGKGDRDDVRVYARFLSLYEGRLRQARMLPPRPREDKDKANKEEIKFSKEEVRAVSEQMLKELSEIVREATTKA